MFWEFGQAWKNIFYYVQKLRIALHLHFKYSMYAMVS